MADETLNLNITATLNDFAKQMAQIPGITDKEAKAMVSTLNANFKRASQEAAKAAKRINSEMDGAFNNIKQGAGALFGGIVNDIDDIAAGMGGLATAVGPVGAALGGIALGAAAGVGALIALESAALGAADALAEAGMPIDPAMMRSIEEANAAMGAFGLAFKSVVATLGGIFGPLLSETIQLTLSFGYAIGDLVGFTGQARVSLTGIAQFLARSFVGVVDLAAQGILKVGEAAVAIGDAFGFSTDTMRQHIATMRANLDANRAYVDSLIEEIDLTDFVDRRVTKLMATSTRMVQARNTSTQAAKQEEEAVSDLSSMYDKLSAAMAKSMEGSRVDQGAAWAAMLRDVGDEMDRNSLAIIEKGTIDLDKLSKDTMKVAGIAGQITGALGDLVTESFNQAANRADELATTAETTRDRAIAAYREARDEFAANADSMTEAERKRAMARLSSLANEVRASKKAYRETSEAEKAAMLDAFHAQQAAAAVQATVQSAINFGSLIPAFSGLGPWAMAAAGGVAATVLTAQLATIFSQAPPAFYTGGMAPGETPAVLHQGESVLNRRATQALGPDVINAINQGRQQMTGSATTVVNLDGRLLATIGREGRRRDSPMPTRLGSMYGVG